MKNNKIYIYFKDGKVDIWKSKEYTDYYYDRKCFIIIRKKRWVGIYNLDSIDAIVIGGNHEE